MPFWVSGPPATRQPDTPGAERTGPGAEQPSRGGSILTADTAAAGRPAQDHPPIGVAVVGAGYWGPNLVRNFQGSAAFDLRWMCDLQLERARRALGRYSTVAATTDYRQVLDDPAVHAVAIATPAATHRDLALQALAAGKHVLVEKPLAASYADGLVLVKEAERRGLTLMCDHTYCYTPAVSHIREMIRSGELGDVHFFDSVRINLGLVQPDIDVLWDLAPHDLSILNYVLPEGVEPVAVAAHGADPVGTGRACVGYLTLKLTDGAIAHVHVNWLSPTKVRTTIVGGSKRTLVWDDLNPSQRISVFDRGIDLAEPTELNEQDRRDIQINYRSGDMVAPALREREALATMAEAFAEAIRTGRPAPTDGRAGLRVVDILEAASRSLAAQGALVGLKGASA